MATESLFSESVHIITGKNNLITKINKQAYLFMKVTSN